MNSHGVRRSVLPVLAAVVAAASLAAGTAGTAGAADARDASASRLHNDLHAIVDSGATSALAVVRVNGQTTSASAGPRRIGWPGRVDPSGRFRAGSVTKSFIATVVLQLVDAGRIQLDAPIQRYVPGVRAGGRIKVRMLLDHTSGLYNLADTLPLHPPSGFLAIRWRHWTPDELLSRAMAHPLVFTPGEDYAYSDTDYLVLGMLVERVTGRSLAAEIHRRIVRPLHLTKTYLPTTPDISGRHAHSYLPTPDGSLVDITRFDPSVLAFGGELVSSAADLNRFFLALTRGRLLLPQTTQLMQSVRAPAVDNGLGVKLLSPTCGGTAVGHDGDVPGQSTWSFVVPGSHRAVTVSMTWGASRPEEPVMHLIDDALCGRIGPSDR